MDPLDKICTDMVYGVFEEDRHCQAHRKPPHGELTTAENQENNEITEFRGDIERRFGTLVKKFGILKKDFRHSEIYFNQEIRICTELHF